MTEKLKSFLLNDKLFYGFLTLFFGLISFLLGYQAANSSVPAVPIKTAIVEQNMPKTEVEAVTVAPTKKEIATTGGEFVASRSGTRYHALSCPGAKQIKEENKIFFASAISAEAAGYKRAANCP